MDHIGHARQAITKLFRDGGKLSFAQIEIPAAPFECFEQRHERKIDSAEIDRAGQSEPVVPVFDFDPQGRGRDFAQHAHLAMRLIFRPDDEGIIFGAGSQAIEQIEHIIIGRDRPGRLGQTGMTVQKQFCRQRFRACPFVMKVATDLNPYLIFLTRNFFRSVARGEKASPGRWLNLDLNRGP